MNLTEINDLHTQIVEHLSAFFKICPICSSRFKDTLDRMILCKKCEREDKIKKILND
jgi:hypothetical protein